MEEVPHASQVTVEAVDGVHLTQLAVGERMSVQHFHVEPGAAVPAHSHHHEQVGYVARGTFTFTVGADGSGTEGGEAEAEFVVGPGDSYSIPGGEPHAARNDGEEPVSGIDVFSPPRPNPDWQE
jgi:quercetin dioxygenase-like cupin family protein